MLSTTNTHYARFHLALLLLLLATLPLTPHHAQAENEIISVTTAKELERALEFAQPGQTIQLAAGLYEGEFTAAISGTITQPITIYGARNAILQGKAIDRGYVFHLDKVDHWVLRGFTLQNASKGIMLDNADYNRLEELQIHTIGEEAVHFRRCSSYNILQNSLISNTGVITSAYGEGVYVGSDDSAWTKYACDADGRDKSDANQILSNSFGPNVRAEAIDVKEGTTGGKICNNRFDATGLSGANFADSWVDIKGNDYWVAYNRGERGANSQLQHGFETHLKLTEWGRNNIFSRNIAYLDAPGYGFHIDENENNHGTIVYANNQVYGAGKGDANIPLSEALSAHSTGTLARGAQPLVIAAPFTVTMNVWLPLIVTSPC